MKFVELRIRQIWNNKKWTKNVKQNQQQNYLSWLYISAYDFQHIFVSKTVKFCEGSKVCFHYNVVSIFSCSRWVVLTGISSALQRKHPWEERVGIDIWDRRYPLTSALSVCRPSAFSASLVHGSNISMHQNGTGSPRWAGAHTSRTARTPCSRVTAVQHGTWDSSAGLPHCQLCTLSLIYVIPSWLGVYWLGWVWAPHRISKDTWGHLN